ncbi:MAG: oligosaccharide flippase family protein [Pyrinomonadaceae bacterium]|nr:oligosaccharide flippase family protein [Phycisphaerales bacterium]
MPTSSTNQPNQPPVPPHPGDSSSAPGAPPDLSVGAFIDTSAEGLSAADARPTTPSPQLGLGRSVKRGMTWSIGNTFIAKFLSLISFAVLAILLTKDDYGLYAISFSMAAFVQVFRDGGVVQLLIQRGEAEYPALRGPVFWMALAFNSGTAIVLACLAPLAAQFYGQPGLVPLLLVIAIATPLATPGIVLQARLSMQLRYGVITRIQMGSAFIRYGGTVGLAWAGAGPLSFVIPLPIIAIFESTTAYLITRETPWRSPANRRQWPALFRQSKWLIFVALANAALNQGGYLVLGAIVDITVVGSFFFAYQLISQVDAVLAATAGVVLFPALARLAGEPARFRAAILRSARVLMLLAAPATVLLVVGIDPLEDIIWHGKWDSAVWPTQALALLYAARVLFMVPSVGYLSKGRFRENAMLVLVCGAGLMLASATGALLSPTAESIAVWLGGYIGVGCLAFSLHGLARLDIPPSQALNAIMPAWISGWLSGAAAIGVDYFVRAALLQPSTVLCNWLSSWGLAMADQPWAPSAFAGFMRLAIIGIVMGLTFAGILRVLFAERLREGIQLAPARFHGKLLKLFRLT